MYKRTITLFNRYKSQTGDIWYPTILTGVDLITDKASINAKMGTDTQDVAKLHIKYQKAGDKLIIGGKTYLPPKEWERLTNDDLIDYITFKSGLSFDFIASGEHSIEIIEDNDYKDGFYNYMNKHYDEVYSLTSVSNPYEVIPHFEIMCK